MDDHTTEPSCNKGVSTDLSVQSNRFAIVDRHASGVSYSQLAREHHVSMTGIRMLCMVEEAKWRTCGEAAWNRSRELATLLDLDGGDHKVLLQAGIDTMENLLDFYMTGNTPSGRSFILGMGPVMHQRLLERLIQLGMITIEQTQPGPIHMQLTAQDWAECLEYWHHCCAACGYPDTDEVLNQDHFVPRSRRNISPGTIVTNIIPLCKVCNTVKSGDDGYLFLVDRLGKQLADAKMREILDYFDWWRARGRE